MLKKVIYIGALLGFTLLMGQTQILAQNQSKDSANAASPSPAASPKASPKNANPGVKMKVEKSKKSPEKITPRQRRALEATQNGENSPSYDPEYGPPLDY